MHPSFNATCPNCFAPQSLPLALRGKQVRCNACNTVFHATVATPPIPPEALPAEEPVRPEPVHPDLTDESPSRFPHMIIYSIGGGAFGILILIVLVLSISRRGRDTATENPDSGQDTVAGDAAPGEFEADTIYRRFSPAVVQVRVRDIDGELVSSGTGFFIAEDGGLITNEHVIDVPAGESVEILRPGRSQAQAVDLISSHRELDLAYLRARGPAHNHLQLTSALPQVGERVFAIGNPLGLTNTISPGIVSGLRRFGDRHTMIQFTAPISPGSSGGPLFDSKGQVIGVTSAYAKTGQNLNLAIPVRAVVELLEDR